MEDNFCLIGNSHTSQFDNPKLNIIYGYGASICGLYNENSVLQFKNKILDFQKNNPEKILVFFLGQSDIEFIYYFKSIKNCKKLDFDKFIEDLINKYIGFVKTYINKAVILGINPTVIINNEHIFNVNFRDMISNNINPSGTHDTNVKYEDVKYFYDNYDIRFKNNLNFNKLLQDKCLQHNIIYVDLYDEIFENLQNFKIKDIYLPNCDDHHLVKNYNLYICLINKLKQYLNI